jgi:hypothetical protein
MEHETVSAADFGLAAHGGALMQLHSDVACAGHPLHGLLPETGPRGATILAPEGQAFPSAVAPPGPAGVSTSIR